MMAWGTGCSSWDDAVDLANLEAFDFREIPDDDFVMTTWHESESLEEVLSFCVNLAHHPTVQLENTLVLQLGGSNRENEILSALDRSAA